MRGLRPARRVRGRHSESACRLHDTYAATVADGDLLEAHGSTDQLTTRYTHTNRHTHAQTHAHSQTDSHSETHSDAYPHAHGRADERADKCPSADPDSDRVALGHGLLRQCLGGRGQ